MRILVLFDLSSPPPEEQVYESFFLEDMAWMTEADVVEVLQQQGHQVKPFGIFNEIHSFLKVVSEFKPKVIFNLCESFLDQRFLEPNIVAFLEMLQTPFTGNGSKALLLCKDKALIKELFLYHGIPTPAFWIAKVGKKIKNISSLKYPLIVKPVAQESSEGITGNSVVWNEKNLKKRILFVHEHFNQDALVEEYIKGRELYISVLGNERLQVLPPRELFFDKATKRDLKMASFDVKWNESYRKKKGVRNHFAKKIHPSIWKSIQMFSKKAYRILGLRGYGRIDLRLREDGSFFFLEVNPNPCLAEIEDFAESALASGIEYPQLLEKILRLACK